jgi:hypothetical protein
MIWTTTNDGKLIVDKSEVGEFMCEWKTTASEKGT